jgi:hypothetical protein
MADNTVYIAAAYVVTWVVLIGYAIRLHGVSRRARAQYDEASRSGGVS